MHAPPEPAQLRDALTAEARRLGFARVGFAPVERFGEAAERLEAWLRAGHAAGMTYLGGPDGRADPATLLPGARTLVSVALPYAAPAALRRGRDGPALRPERPSLTGAIAAYAVGADYHIVLRDKLLELARCLETLLGRKVATRVCVDTAPLLEREAARRAGLGFVGKSTLLIAPGLGTRLLLGELLVDVELPASDTVQPGCGRCTACLTACPTDAFVAPFVLDSRRCISYLTIETKEPVPRELRARIGTRVFGCDECQDVCPFNASGAERPGSPDLAPRPGLETPDLVHLLFLGAADYRKLVKRSALRRIGKVQLQRNAAVALGNTGDRAAVAPLARALATSDSPLTRGHAAWALGHLGGPEARDALARSLTTEADASVRAEIELALAELRGSAAPP
jgi:epoxyqueuosine reductase